MPWKSKRACRGCGRASVKQFCERCRGAGRGREERGSAAKRGYDARWRRYRAAFLGAHPLCVDPVNRHPGALRAATDVDHIDAVDGPDDPRFWDERNHQALCHECHSAKTARQDGGFGRPGMQETAEG